MVSVPSLCPPTNPPVHMCAHAQHARLHCRSVLVSQERACSMCYKRLANAAFAAYPNGMLVHYSCYRRAALQEAGGGRSVVMPSALQSVPV